MMHRAASFYPAGPVQQSGLVKNGADEGNRTLAYSLGSCRTTIILHLLERVEGIEPSPAAWKAAVLAVILHPHIKGIFFICVKNTKHSYRGIGIKRGTETYSFLWCGRPDSNRHGPRPKRFSYYSMSPQPHLCVVVWTLS